MYSRVLLRRRATANSIGLLFAILAPATALAADDGAAPSLDTEMVAAVDDLVAANRILAKEGILPGYGHISMRSPRDASRILISRALAPSLVSATDIVELDLDCRPVQLGGPLLYLERFIHCAIYKARPDVNAVVHAHTPYAVAFGSSTMPMRPVVTDARFIPPDGAPIFDISKVAKRTNMLISTPELGEAMAKSMGKDAVVLLRGHGSAIGAPSLPRAVKMIIGLELNGKILTTLKSIGGPITYLDQDDYGDERLARAVDSELREWKAQKASVMGCTRC